MSNLPFWKVESIGNDFVLVHQDAVVDQDDSLNRLATKVCDRHFGVGSDGLLVVGLEPDGSLLLRMFNPDGTEDFCGNGIRCAFDHALRQGWVSPDDMRMSHHGLPVTGAAKPAPESGFLIDFQLPAATYDPRGIPLNRETEIFDDDLLTVGGKAYRGSVLSTGTSHTIIPVTTLPDDREFFLASPRIEMDPMFPERTSVMWSREDGPFKISLRVWERGAGETQGCGTGSTAAALDYLRRRGSGGRVEVNNPGGALTIAAPRWDAPPTVSGVAAEVFTGVFLQ